MENVKDKIAIASDHAGFKLKEKIKLNLEENGYGVLDLGTNREDAVDDPDYGKSLAQNIHKGNVKKGIALCGTGIGISIAANRFTGIRAALCSNEEMAIQARKHNNANIIAIGARNMDFSCASKYIHAFLKTEFENLNPEKEALYDLKKWHEFEKSNPSAFSGMYQFWVQKI